jgi:hypothetical protein
VVWSPSLFSRVEPFVRVIELAVRSEEA